MRRASAPQEEPQHNSRIAALFITLLIGLSTTLSLTMLVNLPARLDALRRVESEAQRLSRVVQCEEKTLAGLQAAMEYARSNAFVEQWARQHHRTQPGEVLVIFPQDTTAPPSPWWAPFVGKACDDSAGR